MFISESYILLVEERDWKGRKIIRVTFPVSKSMPKEQRYKYTNDFKKKWLKNNRKKYPDDKYRIMFILKWTK